MGGELAFSYVGSQLTLLFGKPSADLILAAMRGAQSTDGIWATALSVVMLLIGASTVFAALESALQQVWGGRNSMPRGWRAFVRARLISFGFILAIGFLLLVSLTLTTALAALRGYVLRHFEGLVGVLASMDFLLSVVLGTGLVALMYRYLPARRLAWRHVLDRSAGDCAAVSPGAVGDRPVSRTSHAAHGVWRRGVIRRLAAVAVLLGADIPVRRGVHGLPRPVAHAKTAGERGCEGVITYA